MATTARPTLIDSLTRDQIQHFKEFGYVTVDNFFTEPEVDEVVGWVKDIQASPDSADSYWKYTKMLKTEGESPLLDRIECLCEHHAGFRDLSRQERIMNCVRQCLYDKVDESTPEPILFKDKVNFKLAGGAGFATHQDSQAGWLEFGNVHLNVAIHLDESTHENGCLQMGVPQRWKQSGHQTELLGPVFGAIPDDVENETTWTYLPSKRTALTIFDSYVLHRSEANTTDKPRRICFFTYQRPNDAIESTGFGLSIKNINNKVYGKYLEDKLEHAPPDSMKQAGGQYRGYVI